MADATLEFYPAFFDCIKYNVFTNKGGSCLDGCCGGFGVGGADYTDSLRGINRVRQAQAVTDDGTVFERFDRDV